MTEVDLIKSLLDRLGVSPVEAEQAVDAMLDPIIHALKAGERANLSGLDTFTVSMREVRTSRNPRTWEPVEISASRSAKFKPGKQIKESLNGASEAREPSVEPI